MRILVLGGTVYLSREIAAQAIARGHDVTVAARGHSGNPPPGARFVQIDRSDPATLESLAAERYDAVIDVARIPRHVKNALEALAGNAGHWTFISTCSVYADDATPGQRVDTAPLLEAAAPDSAQDGFEYYGHNKVACEDLVRQHHDNALIIRAGLIVGPRDPADRFGYWVDRIAAGGEVLAPGSPDEPVQFIDVRDLAKWTLDAPAAGTAGTFDGIRPPITRQSFLEQIAAAVGVEPTFTWVPREVLEAHGVTPWVGEESLGLWLPHPEYAGFLARDTSSAVAAGLTIRPLADTVTAWRDWARRPDTELSLAANLSRAKETEVLHAWHAHGT